MSVDYQTLRFGRDYAHAPTRVFAAWADPAAKRRWFALDTADASEWQVDFRIGGTELYRSAPGATPRVTYDARYYDIVTDERIVVATEVSVDGRRTSVTLSVAEFHRTTAGTRLEIVEQAALLDGLETAESRTGGTAQQLQNLEDWLSTSRDA